MLKCGPSKLRFLKLLPGIIKVKFILILHMINKKSERLLITIYDTHYKCMNVLLIHLKAKLVN